MCIRSAQKEVQHDALHGGFEYWNMAIDFRCQWLICRKAKR